MRRVVIAIVTAVGVFGACVVVLFVVTAAIQAHNAPLDSTGLPIPLTDAAQAAQDTESAAQLGEGILVSAVVGLIAGGLYWWRSGIEKDPPRTLQDGPPEGKWNGEG